MKFDIPIVEFLDIPSSLQHEVFEQMGCTLKMVKESMDKAIVFFVDKQGKEQKLYINKKVIYALGRVA